MPRSMRSASIIPRESTTKGTHTQGSVVAEKGSEELAVFLKESEGGGFVALGQQGVADEVGEQDGGEGAGAVSHEKSKRSRVS